MPSKKFDQNDWSSGRFEHELPKITVPLWWILLEVEGDFVMSKNGKSSEW
jgi:hypothetical protein